MRLTVLCKIDVVHCDPRRIKVLANLEYSLVGSCLIFSLKQEVFALEAWNVTAGKHSFETESLQHSSTAGLRSLLEL